MKKQPVTFEPIGDRRFRASDGSRTLMFEISKDNKISIIKNLEGERKPIMFYDSNPSMVLAMGRLLKHIAGFVTNMKKTGES